MRNIGIDLGIRKIAYSYWEDDILKATYASESHAASRPEELEELADFIYCEVQYARPDYVWVEDNLVGNNVKYSIKLAQTMGAVMLRMAELYHICDFNMYTVQPTKWKKEVLGKGNASKDDIREYMYQRDSAYSVLCGNDQDRLDAACIGYYGYQVAKRTESGKLDLGD